ncbi:MAG: FMN-binding protein, partial [Bacillota bacterium]
RWSNKVRVTVESGRVTDIDVVEDVLFRSAEWTEKIIDSVMEEQSLDVDIISGATITTKAYLKAIENALTARE